MRQLTLDDLQSIIVSHLRALWIIILDQKKFYCVPCHCQLVAHLCHSISRSLNPFEFSSFSCYHIFLIRFLYWQYLDQLYQIHMKWCLSHFLFHAQEAPKVAWKNSACPIQTAQKLILEEANYFMLNFIKNCWMHLKLDTYRLWLN